MSELELKRVHDEIVQVRRGLLLTAAALDRLAQIIKMCYSDTDEIETKLMDRDAVSVAGLS